MLEHIFFVSQRNSPCLVNHINIVFGIIHQSRSFCIFLVDFLSTWLLVFYLGHFVCHLGLLCSFSDNFVCFPSLLDQGHSFDVIIYVVITLSFPLPVICCSDLYYLFSLTRQIGLHSMTTLKS
jgi:hypothetical protein